MFLQELEQIESLVDGTQIPSSHLDVSPLLLTPYFGRVHYETTLHQSIAELDSQCDAVERVTTKLERIRVELHQNRATVKNALAPVNVLPPEILSYSFNLAVNSCFWSTDCAQSIYQTSSSWRAIAIGLPTLWTNIAAFPLIPNNYPQIIPALLPRIPGQQPLSLVVSSPDLSADLLRNNDIVSYLHALHVQVQRSTDVATVPEMFGEPRLFPALRSFRISYDILVGSTAATKFARVIDGNAPSLKNLHFDGIMPERCRASSLETVYIGAVRGHLIQLHHLFQNSPMLKSFTLEMARTPDDLGLEDHHPSLNEPCTLHHLEKFKFLRVHIEMIDYVLRITCAPNLRELTMCESSDMNWEGPVGYRNLFSKSPRIEKLRLIDPPTEYLRLLLWSWAQSTAFEKRDSPDTLPDTLACLTALEVTI